ncbi:MAG: RNA polymerase sigma factor [Nannocystaceae bacterium]
MSAGPGETEDEQLMLRVRAGDRSACRRLVLLRQQRVYALAYRHLGNASDAEEIAQETFMRLFTAAHRYEAQAKFRPYLLRIAANLALNRRARHYRRYERPREPAGLEFDTRADPLGDPERQRVQHEDVARIRACMSSLPPEQRMVLLLTRFERLTYAATAQVMHKSVAAVTSLLWRARRALHASLLDSTPHTSRDCAASTVTPKRVVRT